MAYRVTEAEAIARGWIPAPPPPPPPPSPPLRQQMPRPLRPRPAIPPRASVRSSGITFSHAMLAIAAWLVGFTMGVMMIR